MAWDAATRARVVELYFTTGSIVAAQRAFRREAAVRRAPEQHSIQRWVEQFRSTGSVASDRHRSRPRSVRTAPAIQRLRSALRRNQLQSVSKLAARTGLSQTTVRRILHEDLKLRPFKLQLTQKRKRGDKAKRVRFCKWLLKKLKVRPRFGEVLYMSDEANFDLQGHVNKQNCRIWAEENPHAAVEREQQVPHVTVWCAISATRILGPFFFEEGGHATTVTAPRYKAMLENFFVPALHQAHAPLSRVWFQQDGATAHTSRSALAALGSMFGPRVISKKARVAWPPRSPDLTVADFFLWGFVKSVVYKTPVRSLRQLKQRIRSCVRAVPQTMLQDAFRECFLRCRRCVRVRGGNIETLL